MPIHGTVGSMAIGLALLAPLAAPRATAQEATPTTSESAQRGAMQPLLWLVGDWEGEGWIQRGPAPRSTFTVHEHAQSALGERLIVVEGIGRSAGDGADAGQVVHHAFGVLSWDQERGDYRFSTYRADDTGVDARATVEDGVVTWGFETPNGEVRYVRVTAKAIKKGLVVKPPRRNWTKNESGAAPAKGGKAAKAAKAQNS